MIITTHVTRYGKPFPVSQLSKNSTMHVDVKCPECQEVRNVMYSGVARAGHTVCQKCSVAKACEKHFEKGERHNFLTFVEKTGRGKSLFTCDCGNKSEVNDWSVRSGRTRSCGCARKANRVVTDNRAENHPRWNGGSSSERSRFMQTAIYKAWRHDVFERDRYTCDTCGQVGGKLEAHHLEPYHANEDLRTDMTNGVTLCARCHGDFHSQYGRMSFTAADYQTFNRCNTNGNYRRPAVAKV